MGQELFLTDHKPPDNLLNSDPSVRVPVLKADTHSHRGRGSHAPQEFPAQPSPGVGLGDGLRITARNKPHKVWNSFRVSSFAFKTAHKIDLLLCNESYLSIKCCFGIENENSKLFPQNISFPNLLKLIDIYINNKTYFIYIYIFFFF